MTSALYINAINSFFLVKNKIKQNIQNTSLNIIQSLNIRGKLGSVMGYTLDRAYNTNYVLYKSLENNTVQIALSKTMH